MEILGLSLFQFIGITLAIIIFGSLILNFIIKFKNRNKVEKEKYAYCFPDVLASAMKKVSQRTQYESSLLSMFFILVGMIAFSVYMIFFTEFSWWFKGMFLFNSFCGMIFMISYLVTNYQQYTAFMQITEEMEKVIKSNKLDFNKGITLNPLNPMKGGM